ncbi:MAG: hypothetical protein KFW07_00890 [Mycoplasmataceae bacterium]|nr:hypothetical protein [Mycoplasmataceae bacterium]
MNFESATNFLFSLELNQKTKEFMFNGLYDKMSTIESQLISNINANAMETKNQARAQSRAQYIHVNGTYLKNINGSNIINKGRSRTAPEIHDSLFGDDVSYIRYDTQDVYNIYTKGLDKNFVKRLERAIKNVNGSKYVLDIAIRNMGFFIPDSLGVAFDPLVIEAFLTNIYNEWNWMGLSNDVNFLRANTNWLQNIGMYTNDLKKILEGYSIITNSHYYSTDWRYVSTSIISRFSGFLFSIKEPTFMTQAIAIGIHAINEMLNVPMGNGYSPIENMHDHGLNDWNSQLRNNFTAIGSLAQQASQSGNNKFVDGVEWKVTDGWWTLPKLYLKWQGKRDWIDVSPGQSFNWGNKVPPRY